jgi:hypothetical protein
MVLRSREDRTAGVCKVRESVGNYALNTFCANGRVLADTSRSFWLRHTRTRTVKATTSSMVDVEGAVVQQ